MKSPTAPSLTIPLIIDIVSWNLHQQQALVDNSLHLTAFLRYSSSSSIPNSAIQYCISLQLFPFRLVKELIASNKVMVFSKSYCPFCMQAKSLLRQAGVQDMGVIELEQRLDGSNIQVNWLAWKIIITIILNVLFQITTFCGASGGGEVGEDGVCKKNLFTDQLLISIWEYVVLLIRMMSSCCSCFMDTNLSNMVSLLMSVFWFDKQWIPIHQHCSDVHTVILISLWLFLIKKIIINILIMYSYDNGNYMWMFKMGEILYFVTW